jgi:ATP-dependent Lhr-like helicase
VRSLLTWVSDESLATAVDALAQVAHTGRVGRLTLDRINGEPAFDSSVGEQLKAAGFRMTHRGYRISPRRS